ncbi:MAG: RdgB/HAM1 family non-canonical purine NTP pyrophosphatase [Armatimonadetes bacterium]|nr:RdgB/HAM1 family non-canonical purine NTP pyrophosphatase [Armatimonadota bacterium]MCX7967062.1 RdgB/HAM1 family non-canonical purine NTP pyrophosphatase [Armatimonadota bacterium]MDW8143617.1 RdgB/HAM1 family non-canonical purine NTP pyrophosphatase [Armatimonadota bacterium]
MAKLLIATTNKGKLREILAVLKNEPIEVVTPDKLGITLDYEEVSDDIHLVAREKAIYAWRKSGLPSLAEDTALEVDALGGLPGARAKVFFGENVSDTERWRGLLKLMEGIPLEKRTARFRCAMAVALSENDLLTAEGVLEGVIATEPRGGSGFGYDPVFFVPSLGKTLAELSVEEKNAISHRANALRALLPDLLNRLRET